MSTISRRRIRIALDAGKATNYKHLDATTAQNPQHWRGNDLQVELAVYFGSTLQDIANLASITLEVKAANAAAADAALMSKTVAAVDLDNTLDASTWAAGTKQHALVVFTGTETNIPATTYWLVVSALTNDSPARAITLGVADFIIAEDRTGDTTVPQVLAGTAYTQAEADARYVQQHADQASMRWKSGRWQMYIDGLWYPLVGVTIDGTPALTIGPGEST
jgi:hypothetical protein